MVKRSIALYLFMKGLSLKARYQDLGQTLGAKAIAYPTATRYFRAAKFPVQSKDTADENGVMRTDSVDAGIRKVLTCLPFSSVRDLSRLTCLS